MSPADSRPDDNRASPDATLDATLGILDACLTNSKTPPLPPDLEANEKLAALLRYVTEIQAILSNLSQGNFRAPITLRGYTGGLLKKLQGNVRHMLWMMSQVAEGKLLHHIDCMGDFADSFNMMSRSLREAQDALERQRELYAALTDELLLEVQARMKAQDELKYELERQRELASTDSLTGVANRRTLLQVTHYEWERCRRNHTPLCLAMLDVDRFKNINDSQGHQIGDMVLRHLTAAITRNLRSYDIIGRYGGDEFLILFPATSLQDAANILNRLHTSITQDDFSACGGVSYTISIGLAGAFPHQDAITLENLIAEADKALYLSKERGRNRITITPLPCA